jgi:Mrp family chromosome partitioning ATPase
VTIVRQGGTRKPDLDKLVDRLERSPTRFAGVIANEH